MPRGRDIYIDHAGTGEFATCSETPDCTPDAEDAVPPEEQYYEDEEDQHPTPDSWIRMIRERR